MNNRAGSLRFRDIGYQYGISRILSELIPEVLEAIQLEQAEPLLPVPA